MSFFGRLGSEELKFKVDLVVLRVDTTSSTEPLAVRFTRGNKSSVTPPIPPRSGTYDFNGRTLSTSATLYRKRDKFLPKEAEISVVSVKGSERVFGRVLLDLSRYVELGERNVSEEWQLERCTDRRAKISVRLHTKWLKGAAVGGAEDSEVSGKSGGAAALNSLLEEADNSQAGNLDSFLDHDEHDEQADEEELNEQPTTAQPARRPAAPTGKRGSNGADTLQLPPKGRREERKEVVAQRGRPQQPPQRGGNRQRAVEPDDEVEEEEQQEAAEEEEAEEEEQQEEEEEEAEEQQTVQVRLNRINGRPVIGPVTVITTQQTKRTTAITQPAAPHTRGKPPPTRPPPGRRPANDNDEDEQHEEAGSEVKEEESAIDSAAESEEIIEDDDEPQQAEEEEEEEDGRVVKFGGVEARGSTTQARSPHHTLVQPTKSNLKGGNVVMGSNVPSQATTVRDNITISAANGAMIQRTTATTATTSTSSVPDPSSSPSLSSSSLSSDSSIPASPLTTPPPTRHTHTTSSSHSPSPITSPKHAALAAALHGIKPITPSQIFACTLPEAMTLNPRTSALDVPFVVDRLMAAVESGAGGGLAAEGVFRVAAERRAVDALRAQLQEGNYKIDSSVESVVVAAVLKGWLNAVAAKQPIIPVQLHPQCLAIGQLDIDKQRAQHHSDSDNDHSGDDESVISRPSRPRQLLLQLVPSLPFLTKRLLVRLIALIVKTANPPLSTRNRMNVHALCVVFAPSVLSLQPESGVDGYEMFQRAKWAVRFLEHLVQHSDVLERESGLGGGGGGGGGEVVQSLSQSSPVKGIQPASAVGLSSSTAITVVAGPGAGSTTVVGVQQQQQQQQQPVAVQSGDKRVPLVEGVLSNGNVVLASPRTIRAVAAGKASGPVPAAAATTVALSATTVVPGNRISPASSLSSSAPVPTAATVTATAGRLPPGAVPTIFQQQHRGKPAVVAAPSAIDKALQMAGTDDRRRQAAQQMVRPRPGQRPLDDDEEDEEGEEEAEAEEEEEEVVEEEDSDADEQPQQSATQRGSSIVKGKPAAAAQPMSGSSVVQASPRAIRAAVEQRGSALVAGSPSTRQTGPGRAPQPAARGAVQQQRQQKEEDEGGHEDREEQEEEEEEQLDEDEHSEDEHDEHEPPQHHKQLSTPPNAQSPTQAKLTTNRPQQPPPPPPPAAAGRQPPPPASRTRPPASSAPSPASHLIAASLSGIATKGSAAAGRLVSQPQQSGVYGNQRGRNVFGDDDGSDADEQQQAEDEQEEPAAAAHSVSSGNVVQASPRAIRAAVEQRGGAVVAGSLDSRQSPASRAPQPALRGAAQQQRQQREEDVDERVEEERSESAPRRPSPLPLVDSDDEDNATPPVIHMDEQPETNQQPHSPPRAKAPSTTKVQQAAVTAQAAAVAQEEMQLLQQSSQLLAQQQKLMEQHTKLQQQQQQLVDYEAKVADYERRLKEQADRDAKRQQEEEQRKKKEADDKEKSADKRAQEADREREIERLKQAKALQTAQTELANSKKELDTVNTNLSKRTAEVIELKTKLKAAVATTDSSTQEASTAVVERLKAKDRQLEELAGKLSAQTAVVASLQQEKRAREGEQESKRLQDVAAVEALELQVSKQSEQLEQQAERLQQLQIELKAKDAEITRLSAALTTAESKAAAALAASSKLDDHTSEHKEEEVDDSEYEIYDDDSDETVELKQRVTKLKRLMRRKNQQLVQLKHATLTTTTSPQASTASTPTSSAADSSELQRMLRFVEAKLAAREKEVAEWNEKVEVVGRERAEAVREVSELRAELKKRELHVTELVAQLKQLSAEREEDRGSKAGGKGKDSKEVSRLLEEKKAMEGQLIAMQQQIDAKQTVIDEYEQRLTELTASLKDMEDEAHKVRHINADIEQKMAQLQHDTDQLQAVTEERDSLQQRITAVEAELATAHAEQQRLEKELASTATAKPSHSRSNSNSSTSGSPTSSPSSTPSHGLPPPSGGAVISSVTAQRELGRTKEALDRLKHKFESSRIDWQTRWEAEKHRVTMTQLQLHTLQQENDILRERQIGLVELRDRHTTASSSSSTASPQRKGKDNKQHEHSLQQQLTTAQEQCRYLEKQVRDCESILALARQTWSDTAAAIEQDNSRLEAELAATRAMYERVVEDKGVEYVQLEVLSKRLAKSERAREAMRRTVSELEEEEGRWKGRLEEVQKRLKEREEECELLKGEIVKQGLALKEIAQVNWEMKDWIRVNIKK